MRVKKKKNFFAFSLILSISPCKCCSLGLFFGNLTLHCVTSGARAVAALGLSTQQPFCPGTNSTFRSYLINRRTQLLWPKFPHHTSQEGAVTFSWSWPKCWILSHGRRNSLLHSTLALFFMGQVQSFVLFPVSCSGQFVPALYDMVFS